jgi:hypothetical protein
MRFAVVSVVCVAVCASGCAGWGSARPEVEPERGQDHAELLRQANVAVVASAYALATVDVERLKSRALERERGLLAPRRNGRVAWEDLGAWSQEVYGVDLNAFDAFTLVVAPETGAYVVARGEVDVAGIPGEQSARGGSVSYALGGGAWVAITGAPRQWAFFPSRWSLEAWAAERRAGQMGLSQGRLEAFEQDLGAVGPRVAHALVDVPAWELAGGQGALGLTRAQAYIKGGDVVATFSGDEAARGAVRTQLRALAQQGEAIAAGLRQETLEEERIEEVAEMLVLAHVVDRLVEGHKVELVGEDVVVTAPRILEDADAVLELMTGSLLLESWTQGKIEATGLAVEAQLNRMAAAATDHYTSSSSEAGACGFPASAPPVPAEDTCCASRGGPEDVSGEGCRAGLPGWDAPEWEPMRAAAPVGVVQPMTWSTVSRELAPGVHELVIKARGDADCDGVRSTYQVRLIGRSVGGRCEVEVGPVLSRTTGE